MARLIVDGGAQYSSLFTFGKYAMNLTYRNTPKVLVVDTFRNSELFDLYRTVEFFLADAKEVRHLHLKAASYEMQFIRRAFAWADLIYFPENDLLDDIPIWKSRYIHEIVSQVYEKDSGVLFASGYSGLWFFENGYLPQNDSYYFCDSMLDLQHTMLIPHYEQMNQGMLEKEIGLRRMEGFALESNTAFVHNSGINTFLSTNSSDKAYRFVTTPRWIQRKEVPTTIIQ